MCYNYRGSRMEALALHVSIVVTFLPVGVFVFCVVEGKQIYGECVLLKCVSYSYIFNCITLPHLRLLIITPVTKTTFN